MAYLDEGLAVFRDEWRRVHPGATVYWIADDDHSQDPDISQHAEDDGGNAPGDDKGEVDAVDVMPGKGVTDKDLDDLFTGLHESRDKRILYVIRRDKIFSSVVQPWVIRPYKGTYHGHLHLSVNDNYDNNQSDWHWEKAMARAVEYTTLDGIKLPTELLYGDDDASSSFPGYNHIMRAQALINLQNDKGLDHLDPDGVYGARTAQMVKAVFGGDGRRISLANLRKLHGI